MLLKHRLYIISILAALTLCTWFITSALHFIIYALVDDVIEPFGRLNKVQQAAVVLIELVIMNLCNLMRKFVVKESLFGLPRPLRWRFTPIVLYASAVWLGCLVYLCFHLWRTPEVYEWDIFFELLVLTVWMAVLLGTTMPFSAVRCWLFVWRRWKE